MQDFNPNKQNIRAVIEERVAELLMKDTQLLFSYLYRMDILEAEIKSCMKGENPIACLADIILSKQLYRVQNKLKTPRDQSTNDPELMW